MDFAPRNKEFRYSENHSGSADGSTAASDSPVAVQALRNGHAVKRGVSPVKWFIRRLMAELNQPDITIELWNGECVSGSANSPVRVRIRDRQTFWRVALDPMLHFGEAYVAGTIEVDGDLLILMDIINEALQTKVPDQVSVHRKSWWRGSRRRNTRHDAQKNIHHHYDIGNEFYKLWLDREMVYTCAYFEQPDLTLEQAQVAKMDHICRKLRLQPGETVVEAGCGWGALALHMARHYGVHVRAYNISREQIVYARQRACAENLDGNVEFIQDDWRSIEGRCDAFVSVGMLEHVGIENYRELGRVIRNCLANSGRGLIHTIGQNWPIPLNRWTERYIFPGAQPPTLSEMAALFEPNGFSVLDVENLRLHYAETLHHWWQRFERSADEVQRMFDERFVRMWRLYLVASQSTFQTGWLQLFQVLFAPAASNDIPRTRGYQYVPRRVHCGGISRQVSR